MSENRRRPFYAEYAWAFDLIIDRPVRKECAAVAAWLIERGAPPGAALLDAGCGTGQYAIELARRGYIVHGLEASPELIDVATASAGSSSRSRWTGKYPNAAAEWGWQFVFLRHAHLPRRTVGSAEPVPPARVGGPACRCGCGARSAGSPRLSGRM